MNVQWSHSATTRITLACTVVAALASCARPAPAARTFATPDEAVRTLIDATKGGKLDDVIAIFGPDGKELAASSDAATAKQNREVFIVATNEKWRLVDEDATHKVLEIGNEEWPFPVPLVHDANGWRFDTAAGKEEVLARRIGRNELAVIEASRTYVAAQKVYAQRPHDGKPAGLFAAAFQSDPGRQNGLYWATARGEKRSPLGDLVAAADGRQTNRDATGRAPFHGYYFKILTAQGAAAPGGAKDYLVNGELKGGFALVAWPAEYDASGVMTFIINQDGELREKDLGPGTDKAVAQMSAYDPDSSWQVVP